MTGLVGSFYRAIIGIITLPTKAYISADAAIRTIYRIMVSKEHLLEWTTSEEAERQSKNTISAFYWKMSSNVILGVLILVLVTIAKCAIFAKGMLLILAVLWILAPLFMCEISKEKVCKKMVQKLSRRRTKLY